MSLLLIVYLYTVWLQVKLRLSEIKSLLIKEYRKNVTMYCDAVNLIFFYYTTALKGKPCILTML